MKNNSKILEHYGILGMRWGKRKASGSGGSSSGRTAAQKTISKDQAKLIELKKKKLSEMTDDDLRFLNNRLQMQAQYKKLNPDKIERGKMAVDRFIAGVGSLDKALKSVDTMITIGQRIAKASGKKP